MSLILRWFYDNGERHRAFFRQVPGSHERQLVIAGRDWEHTVPASTAPRLEDLSEETLIRMARSSRSGMPMIDH
jgi:hypothetical protein